MQSIAGARAGLAPIPPQQPYHLCFYIEVRNDDYYYGHTPSYTLIIDVSIGSETRF